ncbi:hypothetical protein HK102_010258 [Quaeritorhiza haematococci]|nr:hypothetical protein HK102_010258 [Quaeritorhiza haematococci]
MGLWPWQKPSEPEKPPKVGGSRAPDQAIQIDYSRPYDFHFYFFEGDRRVFRKCLLIGYTTPADMREGVGRGGEWEHDRWLALRQPDGRTIYVPRDRLQFIEECRDDGTTAEDVGQDRPAG